jgi:hypothetical protein
LGVYQHNREDGVITEPEGSPIAAALEAYLDVYGDIERMTVGHLLQALADQITCEGWERQERRRTLPATWPRSPQASRAELARLAPTLSLQGIEIVFHTRTKVGRPVSIRRRPRSPVTMVTMSDEIDWEVVTA